MRLPILLLPFLFALSAPTLAVDPPQNGAERTDEGRVGIVLAQATTNTRRTTAGPPSPPPRFRGTVYSPGVAEIFWDPAADDGRVVSYRLERDGTVVMERDGRSLFEPDLERGRSYRYAVVAIDDDGEESAPAEFTLVAGTVGETTLPPGGSDRPAPPSDVHAEIYSPGVAELFWTVSPDHPRLAGYEVRRDGELVEFHKRRSQFEPDLEPGRSYKYEIVSVDADDDRSDPARFVLDQGGTPSQGGTTSPGETPPAGNLSITATVPSASLLEGDSDGIDVALEIERQSGASRPATLVLVPESADDQAGLSHSFQPSALAAGASTATLTLQLPIRMAPRLPHERRFRVRVDDGQSIAETSFAISVEPTEAHDVYLLIGQSNMEGYSEDGAKQAGAGQIDEPVARIRQPNVRANNPAIFSTREDFTDDATNFSTDRFITAEDPLHDQRWPGQTRKSGNFIGPGLTFAKTALANTTRRIYLVPAAWGATGFCGNPMGDIAWNASATSVPGLGGTWLTERALFRLNTTLRETGGILRGILWHQGGADSNDRRCAETHEDNLVRLVRRLRSEAQVDLRGSGARGPEAPIPFIVATQSKGSDERGDFSNFSATKLLVDAVHRSVASLVPYSGFVDNDDLVPPSYPCGQSSCVHFGAKAYREQGRRFAEVLRRVSLQPVTAP